MPALEVIMTKLHSGGKFGGSGYTISGGLHGVGLAVVSALSTQLDITVKRDGFVFRQTYQQGKPVIPINKGEKTDEHGSSIHFIPDPDIFESIVLDKEIILQRLRELNFLNRGLVIQLIDEREEPVFE